MYLKEMTVLYNENLSTVKAVIVLSLAHTVPVLAGGWRCNRVSSTSYIFLEDEVFP